MLRRRKLRLGIVSNAQFFTPLLFEAYLSRTLAELGLEATLCSWSWQLGEAKPSKSMFTGPLNALARDGIQPDEVLYVGNDMLNDIRTASLCGCRTALYAGDARSLRLREDDPRCQGVAPTAIINSLHQLGECLA